MEYKLTLKDMLQETDVLRFIWNMTSISTSKFSLESDCEFKINTMLAQAATIKSFIVLLQNIFDVDDYNSIFSDNNINDKDIVSKLEKVNNDEDINKLSEIVKIRFIEEDASLFIEDYREQFLDTEYFNLYIQEILNNLIRNMYNKTFWKDYKYEEIVDNYIKK